MHPPALPRSTPLCRAVLATLLLLAGLPVAAQDREPLPVRLSDVRPGGVRRAATQSWGAYDFTLTNVSDTDRLIRAVIFYVGKPDEQYARDVWVPAHSMLTSWMLVGSTGAAHRESSAALETLIYDRTNGQNRLLFLPGDERRTRGVVYSEREPTTALVYDEDPPDGPDFGRLPQPPTRAQEAIELVRTFRQTRRLSDAIMRVRPDAVPASPQAFDGIDQLVIASPAIGENPAGMQAVRHWLQHGGKVWVMLDLLDPEVVAPLLGDALDFQLVDRVSLVPPIPLRPADPLPRPSREADERPIEMARVLLPRGERAAHTVNGWPAWFTRDVGRGKVVFTTLGPRAWLRPRTRTDPPSPYERYPSLPVANSALADMGYELHPTGVVETLPLDDFRPVLAEQIGYSVVTRQSVGLVFGGFLAATAALGLWLRRSRRPELLGWVAPAAALGATGLFVMFGEVSRRAAPPTVAVAQLVTAVAGQDEAPVHGLLALYRPDSGDAEIGTRQGGFFNLDTTGVDQPRQFVLTDIDSWHWEGLSLPAGVRFAPFRSTAPAEAPVSATATFGPDGLEGRVLSGPFHNPQDALLATANGRNIAVRLDADGAFHAGSADILPPGQFLAGAVLTDQQQRRQALYRRAVQRSATAPTEGRNVLLSWAEPIDLHFALGKDARTVGGALLAMPLRLEHPAPGTRITVPGPLLPCQRILDSGPSHVTVDSLQNADMHLRFQLPPAALPLNVERARLVAQISAPGRRVRVSGRAGDQEVPLHTVESPLDPIRVDITEERLLRLDEDGGLHLSLDLGAPPGTLRGAERWTIDYIELEVMGLAE
jgi:hypothetical protein